MSRGIWIQIQVSDDKPVVLLRDHSKTWNFFAFSLGHFCLRGSRFGFRGPSESRSGTLTERDFNANYLINKKDDSNEPSMQCCESMTFWYGSGSADPYLGLIDPDPLFLSVTFKKATKIYHSCFAYYLLFEGTLTSFFKDKKSQRSHKTVGIKIFLNVFAWWEKDPDPNLWLTDPDPGHQKSYGFYQCCGSGMFIPDPG